MDTTVVDSASPSPSEMSTNVFGPSFPTLIETTSGKAQACPRSFSAQTWMVYVLPPSTSSSKSLSSGVIYSFISTSDCLRDRMSTLLESSRFSVLTETRYCVIGWSLELSDVHVMRRSCLSSVRLSFMSLGALGIPVQSKKLG